MTERTNERRIDPIWPLLEHQGRTLSWLSHRTGYSQSRIWAIKAGEAASPEFRKKCAMALDMLEENLFFIPPTTPFRVAERIA